MSQGSGFKAVADYAGTMLQSYYYTLLYNPANATQHFGIEQGFFYLLRRLKMLNLITV